MTGLKALIGLAFFGSVGVTLLIVGCATNTNWYPFFVTIFYVLAPVPFLFSRRFGGIGLDGGNSKACQEMAIFLTMGIIISAFGLPIVLARHPSPAEVTPTPPAHNGTVVHPVISASACWFTLGANIVVFPTILGFFLTFGSDDMDYSMW